MTKPCPVLLRRIYTIALSVLIVICGICFIAACLDIYHSGAYTVQAVAEHFSAISFPVYLCLAMIAGNILWDMVIPTPGKKQPVEKQYSLILQRLHQTTDLSQCDPSVQAGIRRCQNARKLHFMISLGLLGLGSVLFLIYALNPGNFHEKQINESVIRAMYILIPCFLVPFAYATFSVYYAKASIQKEIQLLRSVSAKKPKETDNKEQAQSKWPNILRIALLCIAVALFIYGFVSGGTADVLTKAVNICTECVGLG